MAWEGVQRIQPTQDRDQNNGRLNLGHHKIKFGAPKN